MNAVAGVEYAERLLARMVPGAEAITLPGLDHLAPLTHPSELGRTITGYVHRLSDRG